MRNFVPRLKTIAMVAVVALASTSAVAEPIYGITDAVVPTLVMFDSTSPSLLTGIGTITGLTAGQSLRAIDFRPSDGKLYAVSSLGDAAQLYTINLSTGALTTIGNGFTLTGSDSAYVSIDFNPVANALRVVTGSGLSYRVNANTGALAAQDTSVMGSGFIGEVAYTNNVVGATSTTLYAYDYTSDFIGRIGSVGGTPVSPNSGQYTPVGSSGRTAISTSIGFDISGLTGIAYLSLDDLATSDRNSELYTVDLATGGTSLVGALNVRLLDFSVVIGAAPRVVPEPGLIGLLAIGLLSFGVASRRRRRD